MPWKHTGCRRYTAAVEDTLARIEKRAQNLINTVFRLGVYWIIIFLTGRRLALIAYRLLAVRISREG